MLASVSLRLSSEGGVAVSSVLGTTHFVRVRRGTQAKKERRQGGAAALPLTSDTARGVKLINQIVVLVFGHKDKVWKGVRRERAVKRDRQKIGRGDAKVSANDTRKISSRVCSLRKVKNLRLW